jgi:hypothetical protein
MDYTAERHAFPGYNSQKVKTFRGLYYGKACNRELFCVKAGFLVVKSAESFDFSRIILRKGMPFCRIIRGRSKLCANHTAERHAFPQDNPLSANYPAESFRILRKVKISPSISTFTDNFRREVNHG